MRAHKSLPLLHNYLPYACVAIPCHGNRILNTHIKTQGENTTGPSISSWMRKAIINTTHRVLSTI